MDDVLARPTAETRPNNLEAYWMPYTANRQFKAAPRLIKSAKGMYFQTVDGREVLDGVAGLWCVNAGHCHPRIVSALQAQAAELDYAPAFQMGHPQQFELANRLTSIAPGDLDHVFYTNSGSESVDTALKIAIAYHRMRGQGERTRLIGRERGYHGVGFGGMSVGGMSPNRKMFGTLFAGTDHLPHTHSIEHAAFSRGQPDWGAHLADDLERIVALHDASTIAAVIVEPFAGSAGVLIPPKGYLERLRAICDKHGILLIFDEVITGFGRLGASFASEYFGVLPDMMTTAKGLTNAAVPMGAVFVRNGIYETFMQGPPHMIELFHGYTYSGHPMACAAGLATQEVYQEEGLFQRSAELAPYFEDAIHSLRDVPGVIDIRNIGLAGAIELQPVAGTPTKRAFDVFLNAYERGVYMRTTGDTLAFTPPLIVEKSQIDQIFEVTEQAIRATA